VPSHAHPHVLVLRVSCGPSVWRVSARSVYYLRHRLAQWRPDEADRSATRRPRLFCETAGMTVDRLRSPHHWSEKEVRQKVTFACARDYSH